MTNKMNKPVLITLTFLLLLSGGVAVAESLNPEGVNPHKDAPRKRITLKQKEAAAKARQEKQKELAARKAAQGGQLHQANQGKSISGAPDDTANK